MWLHKESGAAAGEDLLGRQRALSRFALAVLLVLAAAGGASAQSGGSSAAKKSAPEAGAPTPDAKVAGSFGNWTLLCGQEDDDGTAKERCSLVLPLIEKESQKLVFRVIVTYGPQGNLVLRVDGPTGVALQRGVEFSPDTKKIYHMAFQTCLPMGCKALLLMPEDLKKELAASEQGAITVYALNGKAVQTIAALKGFAAGMAALDKRIGAN
jgi:invasion protein IalB